VLLDVEDIHTYYGQSHVLHGVSFAVNDGEVIALLGVTVRARQRRCAASLGLTPPARGIVRFQGVTISGKEPTGSRVGASRTCRRHVIRFSTSRSRRTSGSPQRNTRRSPMSRSWIGFRR